MSLDRFSVYRAGPICQRRQISADCRDGQDLSFSHAHNLRSIQLERGVVNVRVRMMQSLTTNVDFQGQVVHHHSAKIQGSYRRRPLEREGLEIASCSSAWTRLSGMVNVTAGWTAQSQNRSAMARLFYCRYRRNNEQHILIWNEGRRILLACLV